MKLNATENIQLTEVYRRLHSFHKGNVNDNLIMLAHPSEVKTLVQKGILICSGKESKRVLNWYNLADKGKKLMRLLPNMRQEDNIKFFEGRRVIDFNYFINLTTSTQVTSE